MQRKIECHTSDRGGQAIIYKKQTYREQFSKRFCDSKKNEFLSH